MKSKIILITSALLTVLFVGCAKQPVTPPKTTTPPTTIVPKQTTPNVVTTASIVNTIPAFEKAISNKGTWIIAITKDLSIDKPLVVEGDYKNGKKDANGKDIMQRKIALYAQDAKHTVTARYILTAPKLTFKSPMGSIEHGTFKGDLYISASNFQLKDATIDGNVYFTTDTAKSTFKMDAKSKVTGKQELKK
ncbi:MAG TPA: hypothetical protein VIM70_17900 [Clostridium sp.]|uniref:hypothetical protein n=1 Tax=Clostridium sp. TaxID=1506 RepID=UPI002F92F99B